jgi:hypothetical protein
MMVDLEAISAWERAHSRYYLQLGNGPEREVTESEFIAAEQACGFYPKVGCGPIATSGFSMGDVHGRVKYVDDDALRVEGEK